MMTSLREVDSRLVSLPFAETVQPTASRAVAHFENLVLFWSRGIHKASPLKASSHFFQKAINLCGQFYQLFRILLDCDLFAQFAPAFFV
jgi:hypothetical protein